MNNNQSLTLRPQGQIERQQRQEMTIDEMMSLSEIFVKSGFFADCKSQFQAVVKILAGKELGLEPFAALSELHVIQGKIVMSAGLLAKKVKASGKYDYIVREQTDKVCAIEFLQAQELIGQSVFTIEDARKAQVKNLDRFPRNMLFARAMSNGVRWYCPDVTGSSNVYVEGEIDAEVIDVPAEPEPKGRKLKAVPKTEPDNTNRRIYPNEQINTATGLIENKPEVKAMTVEQADAFDKSAAEDAMKAEAKRNLWARMTEYGITRPDAKTIWKHFAESPKLCERFITFYPKKCPVSLSFDDALIVWESVEGDLSKACQAAADYATSKAQKRAAEFRSELKERENNEIYPPQEPQSEYYRNDRGDLEPIEPTDAGLGLPGEPKSPQIAALEAQMPTGVTRSNKNLRQEPVGFEATAFWKFVKFHSLDGTGPNLQRILKVIELNSEMKTTRKGVEAVTNWEAVIYQVKEEFSA